MFSNLGRMDRNDSFLQTIWLERKNEFKHSLFTSISYRYKRNQVHQDSRGLYASVLQTDIVMLNGAWFVFILYILWEIKKWKKRRYHLKQAPNRFGHHQFKFEKYSTRKELPQLCKILTNICYQACRLSNILCSQGEYELKMYAFLAACPHVYQHCHLVLSSRHVILSIGVVASLGSSLIISNCSPAHVGSLHQPNQCFNHFRHRRSELRLGLHQNVVVKDQIFTSVQKKQNPKPISYILTRS